MIKRKRIGIALMLTSIMVLSIFAMVPSASAVSPYNWRDYQYPIQPQFGSALQYKMFTVDLLNYQKPILEYYTSLGVFDSNFMISYQKIIEFMYRSCDPSLWWFQDEMYIYSNMYGNYPGDSSKPNPQSAISNGKKIFQDEFSVIVELNQQIRELSSDYETATGMPKLIINSMMVVYKQIRNALVKSDMVMAFNVLDMANSCVYAIENSNGKVDLSAVGGPSDYTLENQNQILKWSGQANGDFDNALTGLGLDVSSTRSKLDANQQNLINPSTELDPSAYTNAMKGFEKVVDKSGHALSMSGGMDFCMSSFALAVPAAVGLVLCFGVIVRRKKKNA